MNSRLNTEEIKFMIPDYISGQFNDAEKVLVEEAIRDYVEVREFYNETKGILDFVSSVKSEEPAPGYWNSLLPRIHDKIDSREAQGFSWEKAASFWKVFVPIAAIILIAIVYYMVKPSNTQLTEDKKIEKIIKDSSNNNNIKENIKEEKKIENNREDNIVKDDKAAEKNRINIIKKDNVRKYDNLAKDNTPVIKEKNELPEIKDEQIASDIDIEETAVFASGEGAGFDEETENDLKKLDDSEQNMLLKELENTNL